MITVLAGKPGEGKMTTYEETVQLMNKAAQFLKERPNLQELIIMALVSDAIHQTLINNKR